MRDLLLDLLVELDEAVALAAGVGDPDLMVRIASDAERLRARLGHPLDTLVVGIAGGTGTGKSSLLNAIAGEELALTGGIRPMTSSPMAAVPAPAADRFESLLDELDISTRSPHHGPPWLCLIDLPDADSLERGHAEIMKRLLPRVDAVVWMIDPEKYRDRLLHNEYLRPLAARAESFVFVLNRIDGLGLSERGEVLDDLRAALSEDGIEQATVIATAADPPAGPPLGVEEVVAALETLRPRVLPWLAGELETVAGALLTALGEQGTGFEERWAAVRAEALESTPAQAAERVAEFLLGLSAQVPRPVASRLAGLAEQALAAVGAVRSPRRGARRRMALSGQVDAVGAEARSLLQGLARARAAAVEVAVEGRSLAARLAS